MRYQLIGAVAGAETATVALTVSYLSDYRDPDGQVPPPVLLFRRLPGQEWTAQPQGGPAWVWGPNDHTDPVPHVRLAYTVLLPGYPPFARVLERRIMPNTALPGYWDFTRSDEQQPVFAGGAGTPTPVEVLPGQGPPGERGPGWLLGQGAPGADLGQNGDLYTDALTWDVYARAGGTWALAGNLRGGVGGVGPRGLPGTDGASFPVPQESQLGYVPQADGTRPHGFRWVAPSALGLRLSRLADVDLSTPPTDGQTLVWHAASARWRPGAGAASGGGAPYETTTDDNGGIVITNAEAEADAQGGLTVSDAEVIDTAADGGVTIERSAP